MSTAVCTCPRKWDSKSDKLVPDEVEFIDLDCPVHREYGKLQGRLNICGCGQPWTAYALIRDILNLAPFYENENWKKVELLIPTPGAYYFILGQLDHFGWLEHGGTIAGSWLTPEGEKARDLMNQFQHLEGL